MEIAPILIADEWIPSSSAETFQAFNPATKEPLPERYPVSDRIDVERAMAAAAAAAAALLETSAEQRAEFLDDLAKRLERKGMDVVKRAELETALPQATRLATVELPRTVGQLRQAAQAVRDRSWRLATIDTKNHIRSIHGPIGPVCIFGPNNFPLAFNGIGGGDFAAAIAAGNPVLAKANSSHPGTTRLLANLALESAHKTGMPEGTVQLLYRLDHEEGCRLVAHPKIGATAYTGSRASGLVLKAAADAAGKPIYLELSSINPVVILPHALHERAEAIAGEFQTSCLMGAGQFCTNPGLVLLLAGAEAEHFLEKVARLFAAVPPGTLLSEGVERNLSRAVETLAAAGAEIVAGGRPAGGKGFSFQNTLLRTSGKTFLHRPAELQTEAFGNASLFVFCSGEAELLAVLEQLEGNLTGTIYSDKAGADDGLYAKIEPLLRAKVGRLLNDKMPTGVAVSPAMNHGGPYPATGHPGFTAVGMPASIRRFTALWCYDAVRPYRLPPELHDQNLPSKPWRLIDGEWSTGDVPRKT